MRNRGDFSVILDIWIMFCLHEDGTSRDLSLRYIKYTNTRIQGDAVVGCRILMLPTSSLFLAVDNLNARCQSSGAVVPGGVVALVLTCAPPRLR